MGDSEADYWDWTREFMAPEETALASHYIHEDCGCMFCTRITGDMLGDIWEQLSAAERDAVHRTVVPGRRVQR